MNRTEVTSSTIASIGYDEASETLELEFKNGRIYQYYNVPAPYYDSLIHADSIGAYFNAHIRNAFAYSQL